MNYTFDWSILLTGQYRDWLLAGLKLTLILTLVSMIGSFLLGLTLAVFRQSRVRVLRTLTITYLEFIRNTPLVVQIFFWYFGSYKIFPISWTDWLNASNQFEFIAAAIALIVYTSAFIAEDIRSGILSIPREQMEAALSSGLSPLSTMRFVILPQAVRITIPPIVNQFLNLAKNSSLAMTIGVAELTYQARQIESHTLKGFEAFTATTLLYLLISLIVIGLIHLSSGKSNASTAGGR